MTYEQDTGTQKTCNGSVQEAASAVKKETISIREIWNPAGNSTLYALYSNTAPSDETTMRPIAAGQSYCCNKATGVPTAKLYVKGTNTETWLYVEG